MKRIYIDMDGVLANFYDAFNRDIAINPRQPFPQSRFGFFTELEPINGAIEAFKELQKRFDVWILTRPSVANLSCYSEKAYWLRKYFGDEILQKTVMAPDKSIVKGDYLIDDQTDFGQTEFEGELILFGSSDFPNWQTVLAYFQNQPSPGLRWILKYEGDSSFEEVSILMKAANIDVIDHSNFPNSMLVSATNANIGNLQHFPLWKVYPEGIKKELK